MSETIVLAHEDTAVSQEVQAALETAGYTVTPVTTGQSALNLCQTALPDMLIMGTMSDVEPFSLLQQLQSDSNTKDIRVMWLMSSDFADAAEWQRAWDAGFDATLPPISGEEIARLTRKLFEYPGAIQGENSGKI